MNDHKTIATHNGAFHADDVFGVAVLMGVFPSNTLIRTRDPKQIDAADFAVDVGGVWEPLIGRFDHHQRSFSGARPAREKEGEMIEVVGYASAGLVWHEFGADYVRALATAKGFEIDEVSVAKIVRSVDGSLVQYIDLVDTGKESVAPGIYGLSALLSQLNTHWMEEQSLDAKGRAQLHRDRFEEAMSITRRFLDQMIVRKIAQFSAADIVRKSTRLMGGKVLHLEKGGMPWTRIAIDEMPDVMLVIYPVDDGAQHQIHTVPVEPGSFKARMDLPASWSGLRDEEMAAVTGVEDSVFCHTNLFIGGARSFDGVLRLAEAALV